jgi:hypothetical protein
MAYPTAVVEVEAFNCSLEGLAYLDCILKGLVEACELVRQICNELANLNEGPCELRLDISHVFFDDLAEHIKHLKGDVPRRAVHNSD